MWEHLGPRFKKSLRSLCWPKSGEKDGKSFRLTVASAEDKAEDFHPSPLAVIDAARVVLANEA